MQDPFAKSFALTLKGKGTREGGVVEVMSFVRRLVRWEGGGGGVRVHPTPISGHPSQNYLT